MDPAIAIKNLSYSYSDSRILKGLSFNIKKGEFFVIIGPNGSGKTTLMKIAAGIIKGHKGKVNILGQKIDSYTKRNLAKKIAFVPQMIPTDSPFTVSEVVLMGRSPHSGFLGFSSQKDVEIAMEAISFAGVEHLAHRRINQLSGGESQRAFIAKAICQEPEIILLDEPTASLDLAHQIKTMDLMEKLKKEKKMTVVMISHDINLAAMYGTCILLLKNGKIISLGSPEDVLTFDTLEKAYGCKLLVDKSPVGLFTRITPVPQRYLDKDKEKNILLRSFSK